MVLMGMGAVLTCPILPIPLQNPRAKEGQGPHSKKSWLKSKDSSANVTNDVPESAWSTIITGDSPLPCC